MMDKPTIIEGFSSLPLGEKWQMVSGHVADKETFLQLIQHLRYEEDCQDILDQFSENTLTNFPLPYGIIPNMMVNGKMYMVPMVTEESSVVAAAASAAKFWAWRGGFHATTTPLIKEGQVFFQWDGKEKEITRIFTDKKEALLSRLKPVTESMEKRGGGIRALTLEGKPDITAGMYVLHLQADTVDAMGANFLNSVLEALAAAWADTVNEETSGKNEVSIIMAILSNYTPGCLVEVSASCPMEQLVSLTDPYSASSFAQRLLLAATIASADRSRAVTHNKGIFNGIDAVALATGNDFRAIEANGHAWASRNGMYQSLSEVTVDKDRFTISLRMPLAIGTTGGLTDLHPLAARSLEILGHPSASDLMMIMAATGLASNFAAIKSLVTGGIQKGHMRLHLNNLLLKYNATPSETDKAISRFRTGGVSSSAVKEFLTTLRNEEK